MPRPTIQQTPGISNRGTVSEPTEDAIRLRAFEIYQARGGQGASDVEDWEQARRELAQKDIAARTGIQLRPAR